MIKVDSIGQEYCLPCADSLEIEGVIVERESACAKCEGEGLTMDELEILRAEWLHARENPLFDEPEKYCVLLDLIRDRIDQIEIRYI